MTGSRYRIVLRGRLADRYESAFDGMVLEPGQDQSVLIGDVRDQAHLYGLLDRLRDFGIDLVAVEPADYQPGPTRATRVKARWQLNGRGGVAHEWRTPR